MRNQSSGFYSSSLEMLLDTMCNMLGGVIFIALLVALVAKDSRPTRAPATHESVAQLQKELTLTVASNNAAQAELRALLQRLQDPNLQPQTNRMHLPNVANTTKLPWLIIMQHGQAYPLDVMPGSINGMVLLNRHGIVIDPRQHYLETRPGAGEDAVTCVKQAVDNFKASTRTNYYFAFLVYNDSFPAFIHARDAVTRLGYQYGWNPLPEHQRIQAGSEGERILPQN